MPPLALRVGRILHLDPRRRRQIVAPARELRDDALKVVLANGIEERAAVALHVLRVDDGGRLGLPGVATTRLSECERNQQLARTVVHGDRASDDAAPIVGAEPRPDASECSPLVTAGKKLDQFGLAIRVLHGSTLYAGIFASQIIRGGDPALPLTTDNPFRGLDFFETDEGGLGWCAVDRLRLFRIR